jgi:hypothetical protein
MPSMLKATRRDPPGSGSQRQAYLRAPIPRCAGITAARAIIFQDSRPSQPPHHDKSKRPQPTTAPPQLSPGFSRQCDRIPRGEGSLFRDLAHISAGKSQDWVLVITYFQ